MQKKKTCVSLIREKFAKDLPNKRIGDAKMWGKSEYLQEVDKKDFDKITPKNPAIGCDKELGEFGHLFIIEKIKGAFAYGLTQSGNTARRTAHRLDKIKVLLPKTKIEVKQEKSKVEKVKVKTETKKKGKK